MLLSLNPFAGIYFRALTVICHYPWSKLESNKRPCVSLIRYDRIAIPRFEQNDLHAITKLLIFILCVKFAICFVCKCVGGILIYILHGWDRLRAAVAIIWSKYGKLYASASIGWNWTEVFEDGLKCFLFRGIYGSLHAYNQRMKLSTK